MGVPGSWRGERRAATGASLTAVKPGPREKRPKRTFQARRLSWGCYADASYRNRSPAGSALDDAVERGGFALAIEDADLRACIDDKLS